MSFDPPKDLETIDTEDYKVFSRDFDYCIDFFQSLSGVIGHNRRIISFITNKGIHYLDTSLIDSAANTLKSIKLCCSIRSFADANTLIRKLRDDLMLYVFILDVINHRMPFIEEDVSNLNADDPESFASSFLNLRFNNTLTEDEQLVAAWFSNTVAELPTVFRRRLSFEHYMQRLKRNENINQIITKYNLQHYWESLRRQLNNYVHNNGKQLTCQNFTSAGTKHAEKLLQEINIRTCYISSFFLVSIFMVESALLASTDMVNYIDFDTEPPLDCQYWLAPFVQEFIDSKVAHLHPELKDYLRDNNSHGMKID